MRSQTRLLCSVRMALCWMAPILAVPLMAVPTDDPTSVNGGYLLTTDVQNLGCFTEASGIGSETEVSERKVIDANGVEIVEKIPGRLSFSQVTLRRRMGSGPDLWTWRQMVVDGNVIGARATVTLTKVDQSGSPVAEWTFQEGWPCKLGITGTANGGDLMEELTFVHQGGQRGADAVQGSYVGAYQIEAGDVSMYFDSASFDSENEVIEHKVVIGGVEVVSMIPGRLRVHDIVLTRPLDGDARLWDWRRLVENGNVAAARRSVTLIAYQPDGTERARWTGAAAWPSKLEASMLPDSAATETLHLTVEGFTLANSAPALLLPTSFNAAVGSTAEFAVTASDPNDDPVELTQLAAPAGASFSRGTFSWPVPVSAVDSTALVTFRADDLRSAPNSIVTKSLTITIPRDYDADSMDDDWEVIWFGSIGNAPGDDKDGDGASNLNEFLAATSPVDPASLFKVGGITKTISGVEISYTAEPGIQYQLEMNSTGLDRAGWSPIGPKWTETNPASTLRSLTDDTASIATAPMRFYRILARRL